MRELIEYIVKNIVTYPTQVRVFQNQRGGEVHIRLQVSQEDMGRVIGKGGRVANAMRSLLNVAAAQRGKRATLDIDEPAR
jgi:predicted RNA-binding protein YlqC (UPF0109 family)